MSNLHNSQVIVPGLQPVVQASVENLFAGDHRYSIPDHQRPYRWTTDEVQTLLDDVYKRWKKFNGHESLAKYYQFNAITWFDDSGRRVIFDGQQRVTTLYLLLAGSLKVIVETLKAEALDDCVREHLEAAKQTLLGALRTTNMSGGISLRLVDQFTESNEVLQSIVKAASAGELVKLGDGYSRAYRAVLEWIASHFKEETEAERALELTQYLTYLMKFGVFSVHQVESEEDGWDAFDKANNRGRPLTEADRLKHWLWGAAKEGHRQQLVAEWNAMMLAVRKKGLELDEVLSLVLTADFARPTKSDPTISKKHIFKAVTSGPARAKAEMGPAAFTAELHSASKVALLVMDGYDAHGKPTPALQVARRLYGKVPTQVVPLLIAARHTSSSIFEGYSAAILDAWFVHNASAALPTVFTKARASWLPAVRRISNDQDLAAFAANSLQPFKSDGAAGFANWFRTLSLRDADGKKSPKTEKMVRFVLGRCEEKLREEIDGATSRPAAFTAYYLGPNPNAQIEHILPEMFDEEEVDASFGGIDSATDLAQTIGNLTLLTRKENGTANNKSYIEKLSQVYDRSKFCLARVLHTQSTGTVGSLLTARAAWDIDAVRARHAELYSVVCRALEVPAVESFAAGTPSAKTNRLGFRLVQADSGATLVSLARSIAEGKSAKEQREVLRSAGLDPERQYSYYASALRELGIIVKVNKQYELSPAMDATPTELTVAGIILEHPASKLILSTGEAGFTKTALAKYDRSATTTERQVKSHVALLDWARDVVAQTSAS